MDNYKKAWTEISLTVTSEINLAHYISQKISAYSKVLSLLWVVYLREDSKLNPSFSHRHSKIVYVN